MAPAAARERHTSQPLLAAHISKPPGFAGGLLVHHADVVTIEGESYRVRESEATAKERRASRKAKKETPIDA